MDFGIAVLAIIGGAFVSWAILMLLIYLCTSHLAALMESAARWLLVQSAGLKARSAAIESHSASVAALASGASRPAEAGVSIAGGADAR